MKPQKAKRTRSSAIVVTGTPGTGKTTISKSLARQFHADYVPLTRLVIDRRLMVGVDRQRRTVIVDLKRTRGWLRKSLREDREEKVIDTHLADAIPKDLVTKVIVLRCHPRILESRLRRKGWGARKIRENVLAEILDSCYVSASEYYGVKKTVQVDTSRASVGKSVERCVAIIKKNLDNMPSVDWIAALDRESLLETYMR